MAKNSFVRARTFGTSAARSAPAEKRQTKLKAIPTSENLFKVGFIIVGATPQTTSAYQIFFKPASDSSVHSMGDFPSG